MTKFTKIVSVFVLTALLVMSFAVSAFAANITINSSTEGSEYSAFKLLGATDGGDGKFAYALNDKYADVLASVIGQTEEDAIIAYINSLTSAMSVRKFADSVYNAIVEAGLESDYTAENNVFTDVEQGYYLIAETGVGNSEDTFSLVMLDTAGTQNITVSTKEDKPTVEKKVEEINDSTGASSWGDSADYDVGDSINYTITGTISNKYNFYGSYYYSFTDVMDKGLTYNQDAKVYIVKDELKVDVTSYFTFDVTTNEESGLANGFVATANLKEIETVTVSSTAKVVIEYTATLNEYAIKGKPGNENVVYLEYENNPYVDADGDPTTPDKPQEPGKTPEDINIVFTFNTIVNKVDKDGNALAGAGFTLFKWQHAENKWVAVGDEITGVTTFNFLGLDAGKYKLSETTVPNGYNKCDDIEFEIVAEYELTTDPDALTALSVKDANGNVISSGDSAYFSADLELGNVETSVENLAGTELPETGGIGTTIFYIVGALLVIAAIVLLVAKKIMAKN